MARNLKNNIEFNVNIADLPENKEDFQLIWLDASLNESSDILVTQKMLRMLNTNAQFYTDMNECLELINSIKTEHILLVVSGQLARTVLPKIHSLRSVRAVFIFCETRELHIGLLNEYPVQTIDIFTDQNTLFRSISETMQLIAKQDVTFHLFDRTEKSTRDLTKQSASFLWHQLLIDVLKKMPADEQAKNEMLDHCAAYYRHNKVELQKIQHFRTSYISTDAVRYYTEESFLYRLLNKALRTEDIELLHIFRFFIIDLCAQLEDRKKLLAENEPLILYRGQQMPKEEFENLKTKIGSVIAKNGFLSTSRAENFLLTFANSSKLREKMIQVLLTIKADPKLKTVIFADVSRQSVFQVEEEVLFSLGAVFRIDGWEFNETSHIGKLSLTATDEGSETVTEFLDAQKTQLEVYSPMIYFGRLLMNEMNEVDRAATYFQTLLQTLPQDHPDIAEVYNQIGATHYMKSNQRGTTKAIAEKQKALEMFEKALEIRRNMFGENDIRVARSMNNIGSIYNDRGEYDRALEYYQRGLHIVKITKLKASLLEGNLLSNCAILNDRIGNNDTALSFYIQTDEIYSQCLPNHHPTRVENMRCIAETYWNNEDFDNALKYYKREYEGCEIMLNSTESKFEEAWKNIIHCCLKLDNKELAITYLDRVLQFCERASQNVTETSNNYILFMTRVFELNLDFETAVYCYRQYLKLNTEEDSISELKDISDDFWELSDQKRIRIINFKIDTYEKLFPCNNLEHSNFLIDMGIRLEKCENLDFAYRCYQKAFSMLEQLPSNNQKSLFTCFKKLVDFHFEKNDTLSALTYLEKALKKCNQDSSNNNRNRSSFLLYIADKYEDINDISNTINYYAEALKSTEATKSSEDIYFLLQKIFEVCISHGKNQLIQTYIQYAIHTFAEDPIYLCQCYLTLENLYYKNHEESKALSYRKQFLLVSEVKNHSFTKILDEIWIDFVISLDKSEPYRINETPYRLIEFLELCTRILPSHHPKIAIVLWILGIFHEQRKSHATLKYYQEAMTIWEKNVYKFNDTRTIDLMVYLVKHYRVFSDYLYYEYWLISPNTTMFFKMNSKNNWHWWQCVIQRLKYSKMIFMNHAYLLHEVLEYCLLDTPHLCSKIIQPILNVCTKELYYTENCASSLDIHTVICCLEFVTHWYFVKKQYLESLRYRQHQLELEKTVFHSEHAHVGWSLWFIGMIFQQMNNYNLSLEYFYRALKIVHNSNSEKSEDIEQLQRDISQVEQLTSQRNDDMLMQTANPIQQIIVNKNQCIPELLKVSLHLD